MNIFEKPSQSCQFSGAWTANFEEANTEGGPIAMDTSPWDTAAKEPAEKWADFTNKIPGEENKDNWADFSNFSNISR